MIFTLQLKRLGKKKVKEVPFTLNQTPKNLEALLIACVKNQVDAFNTKRTAVNVIGFLTPAQIEEQAHSGKIDFGDNVLLAFKDGLFVVFVDDIEITDLQTPLQLSSDSVIAFIRLTFLVGTYW